METPKLITKRGIDDWLINDLTREMDNHLSRPKCKFFNTYILDNFRNGSVSICYPGATIGYIEYNKNKVITDIGIFEDTGTGDKGFYKDSVIDALQKFIGMQIVVEECEQDG